MKHCKPVVRWFFEDKPPLLCYYMYVNLHPPTWYELPLRVPYEERVRDSWTPARQNTELKAAAA